MDLESKVGNKRPTESQWGILGLALGFCQMLKMGPRETKPEGGFLENQMEKVLWISGAWGTWQEPPTTLLFPAHCLGLQQIWLGEHLTLPCLRWSDFTQMEWIGVDRE